MPHNGMGWWGGLILVLEISSACVVFGYQVILCVAQGTVCTVDISLTLKITLWR